MQKTGGIISDRLQRTFSLKVGERNFWRTGKNKFKIDCYNRYSYNYNNFFSKKIGKRKLHETKKIKIHSNRDDQMSWKIGKHNSEDLQHLTSNLNGTLKFQYLARPTLAKLRRINSHKHGENASQSNGEDEAFWEVVRTISSKRCKFTQISENQDCYVFMQLKRSFTKKLESSIVILYGKIEFPKKQKKKEFSHKKRFLNFQGIGEYHCSQNCVDLFSIAVKRSQIIQFVKVNFLKTSKDLFLSEVANSIFRKTGKIRFHRTQNINFQKTQTNIFPWNWEDLFYNNVKLTLHCNRLGQISLRNWSFFMKWETPKFKKVKRSFYQSNWKDSFSQ